MRIINTVKKMLALISKDKRKRNWLFGALSAITVVVTVALILQSLYLPAYAIKINGESIGVVAV